MRFHFLSFKVSSVFKCIPCDSKKALTSSLVENLSPFPHLFTSSTDISGVLSRCASIFHDSSGINDLISRSRSTRSFTATDCTLHAERPVRIFFQRTGETSYQTIRSSIRRDCCAFTRSISIFRGWLIA